jgi:hypothetical protein
MTKIITCAELRHRRLEELQALFRSLEIELLRTEPGSSAHQANRKTSAPWRHAGQHRAASDAPDGSSRFADPRTPPGGTVVVSVRQAACEGITRLPAQWPDHVGELAIRFLCT